jgi:hypothetical protein
MGVVIVDKINLRKNMTIRELINRLEKIDKEVNRGAHGEPDIRFTIDFEDEKLNEDFWCAEIVEVAEDNRIGCYCVDSACIRILISKF